MSQASNSTSAVAQRLQMAKSAMKHGEFDVRTNQKTPIEAKQAAQSWKEDTNMLSSAIQRQLEFCKALRSKDEVSALLDDDPRKTERKLVRQFLRKIKMDIRHLHEVYGEKVLAAKRANGIPSSGDAAQSGQSNRMKNGGSEWDIKTSRLENELSQLKVERDVVDNLSGRRTGSTIVRESTAVSTSYNMNSVLRLIELRDELIESIGDHLLTKKKSLDASIGIGHAPGITRNIQKPSRYEGHSSVSIKKLTEVTNAFLDLERLVKRVKVCEEGLADADEIARIELQKTALQEQNDTLKEQIKDLKYRITLLQEQQKETSKGKLMVQNTLTKLDESLQRQRELEIALKDVTSEKTHLVSRVGILGDQLAHSEQQIEILQQELRVKTSWYEPKITQLEADVQKSMQAMQDIRVSVELISGMYQAACDDCTKARNAATKATKERDEMAKQLKREIRKVCEYKYEAERERKVQIQLKAAHESITKAYRELKQQSNIAN